MKSRETLIRLKKFQVDEKRRRVAQIEGMIADFQRMSVDLEREIQTEQDRAGINDPSHFAYPTYAKAAIQRRENLTRSADELRVQLEDAKAALGSLRGTEEGRAPGRARPGPRARRGKRPRAGRSRQHRPDARPHRRHRLMAPGQNRREFASPDPQGPGFCFGATVPQSVARRGVAG